MGVTSVIFLSVQGRSVAKGVNEDEGADQEQDDGQPVLPKGALQGLYPALDDESGVPAKAHIVLASGQKTENPGGPQNHT